jgi:hypothetical protein
MTEINKEVQRIVREYKLTPSKFLFVEDIKQEEINTWFENIKEDLINHIHCCMELKCGDCDCKIKYENIGCDTLKDCKKEW